MSFCSMHERYQHIFLNQNSARILNNTKTSKRKLRNRLIAIKLFKSQLCSAALFGGFFFFFRRNNEIIYEFIYHAVKKKTCEEKSQGKYKQI